MLSHLNFVFPEYYQAQDIEMSEDEFDHSKVVKHLRKDRLSGKEIKYLQRTNNAFLVDALYMCSVSKSRDTFDLLMKNPAFDVMYFDSRNKFSVVAVVRVCGNVCLLMMTYVANQNWACYQITKRPDTIDFGTELYAPNWLATYLFPLITRQENAIRTLLSYVRPCIFDDNRLSNETLIACVFIDDLKSYQNLYDASLREDIEQHLEIAKSVSSVSITEYLTEKLKK
jgi:hypothetical protein